jgi:hypothetical protein
MRTYLELSEVLLEGSIDEADFIRIDVTGWSDEDVKQAMDLLREHAKVYEHYVLQVHYCYHEEGGGCGVSVVESA